MPKRKPKADDSSKHGTNDSSKHGTNDSSKHGTNDLNSVEINLFGRFDLIYSTCQVHDEPILKHLEDIKLHLVPTTVDSLLQLILSLSSV